MFRHAMLGLVFSTFLLPAVAWAFVGSTYYFRKVEVNGIEKDFYQAVGDDIGVWYSSVYDNYSTEELEFWSQAEIGTVNGGTFDPIAGTVSYHSEMLGPESTAYFPACIHPTYEIPTSFESSYFVKFSGGYYHNGMITLNGYIDFEFYWLE